jgi:hypothetical protein
MKNRSLGLVGFAAFWLTTLANAADPSNGPSAQPPAGLDVAQATSTINGEPAWITFETAVQRVAMAYSSLGDRVVEAWFEMSSGRPNYVIRSVSNAGFRTVLVDAQTGAYLVLNGEVGGPTGEANTDDAALAQYRARAAVTASLALDNAVKAAPLFVQDGVPFAAYFNLQTSQLVISVEVVHGAGIERLDFNVASGTVTFADESAFTAAP